MQHLTEFAGLPVVAYDPHADAPADPAAMAWRIDTDYDSGAELFETRVNCLMNEPWVDQVQALIIGEWGEAYDTPAPLDLLQVAVAKMPSLRGLFLGEMISEECEISWIQHGDITPLIEMLPRLEVLTIRGSSELSFKPLRHERLREFVIQCGGLPGDIVRAVAECDFPELTHLELWFGTDMYGGDAVAEDAAPILAGLRLPKLRYLGLRNAEIADALAAAVAGASIVGRLEVLDLSMGLLTDTGATALLSGQPLTHLRRLDLHHHFLSEAMMERLTAEYAGVELDLDDAGDPDDDEDRYVEVSE